MRPLSLKSGSGSGTPPSVIDNDSSFTIVRSPSWTGNKLKDRMERANSWVKKIKQKRKSTEPKPSRPEQLRQRRCADIEKLNWSQLVAKCLTLQLENGDLTLQIQSFHEQVRNLKFASAYLANRLSSFERAGGPQSAEDNINSGASSLVEMRALPLADENEEDGQRLSNIKQSKEEKKEETPEEPDAKLLPSKNDIDNEEPWVDVAAVNESTNTGQQLSPAKDPSIELDFEEWLES